MKSILVTGASGQIGTDLTRALRQKHGDANVLATGRRAPATGPAALRGAFDVLDVTDRAAVDRLLQRHQVDVIYHLAAKQSAVSEIEPQLAWAVNMSGLYNVLDAARAHGVRQLFWPSSIAVFGSDTPREQTPQDTVMRPTTIYGVAKVAGELLCDYYVRRFGLDVRGVRYSGVISSDAPPGGGTTDYGVEMFYAALGVGRYTCFVRQDTVLPMIYMPDCIKAALDVMDADLSRLRHHNSFNLAAMNFSAGDLADEITKHVPGFVCMFDQASGRRSPTHGPRASTTPSRGRSGDGSRASAWPRWRPICWPGCGRGEFLDVDTTGTTARHG